MKSLLYQLGRAFAFSRIQHAELETLLRWAPLVISGAVVAIFAALPTKPPLTGDGSLSRHMLSVFSTLPGFFIAALAAVATFHRTEMDTVMPHPAPKLELRTGSDRSWFELTFRMFLSHMFGYLTAMSFLAVFMFLIVDLIGPVGWEYFQDKLTAEVFSSASFAASCLFVFAAGWVSSTIVVTTLLGIYFLAERMHRPAA